MTAPVWEATLIHSIRGAVRPTLDPDEAALYISDGWGTSGAAIKLRKLSIHDGHEVAFVYLKDIARCLQVFPSGDQILVATNKRLLSIDRDSFTVRNKWNESVHRYTDFMAIHEDKALLMSSGVGGRTSLTVFDLTTG